MPQEMPMREEILVYLKDQLERLPTVKTIKRTRQTYESLQQFAETQFPVISLVGRWPIPNPKESTRRKATVDKFISTLPIDLWVYLVHNEESDTTVSYLASELWGFLQDDLSLGDRSIRTFLTVEEEPVFLNPYIAIKVTMTIQYIHGTGGI